METTAQLEQVFSASPIGVGLMTPEGRFLRVNGAYCAMLGRTETELLALGSDGITHPDDQKRSQQFTSALIDGTRLDAALDTRLLHKDGHVVSARVHASVVRAPDGTPQYLVGQVEDITALQSAEAENVALAAGSGSPRRWKRWDEWSGARHTTSTIS